MRTVIQRVQRASVVVKGELIGSIGPGLLALVGVARDDTQEDVAFTARKLEELRIFSDPSGKFNDSLATTGGALLCVSQFTLLGDTRKGRRPSFVQAAPPAQAEPLFNALVERLRARGITVKTGQFGAQMEVSLLNDGPVTLILDSALSRKGEPRVGATTPKVDLKMSHPTLPPKPFPPLEALQTLLESSPDWVLTVASAPPPLGRIPEPHLEAIRARVRTAAFSGEQIRTTLDEILLLENPASALEWLNTTHILKHYLQELEETVSLSGEEERRHKHVWGHTKQVVRQAPRERTLRWAALFHDIGKAKTRAFEASGKVTFYAHDIVGAGMFRTLSKRLGLEKTFAKTVYNLIKYHLRPGQYESSWTDSAVRRMGKEIGPNLLKPLLDLGRADITSKRQGKREAAVARIDELERRLATIQEEDARVPPLPKGLGTVIMEKRGIAAGPLLGKVMRWLLTQIEEGRVAPHQAPEYYIPFLDNCPLLKKELQ